MIKRIDGVYSRASRNLSKNQDEFPWFPDQELEIQLVTFRYLDNGQLQRKYGP